MSNYDDLYIATFGKPTPIVDSKVTFKRGAIMQFGTLMKRDGWTDRKIREQINLVRQGVRDVRLCDNCIVLLDNII